MLQLPISAKSRLTSRILGALKKQSFSLLNWFGPLKAWSKSNYSKPQSWPQQEPIWPLNDAKESGAYISLFTQTETNRIMKVSRLCCCRYTHELRLLTWNTQYVSEGTAAHWHSGEPHMHEWTNTRTNSGLFCCIYHQQKKTDKLHMFI